MAIEGATNKPSAAIQKTERLYSEIGKGKQASELLSLLDPMLEERLGLLLSQFEASAPELGPLLDLRARISEVWRMRRALKDAVKIGKSSEGLLEKLILDIKEKIATKSKED